MRLSTIFDQLTYGELSSLALGGIGNSGILEKHYPKVIANINLGLTELHKRFILKTSEVMVQQADHIQNYELHSRFAETNELSLEPVKYIMDSVYKPFQDDVLKIEQIYTEIGQEVCLNNLKEPCSYFTPSYNVVQVPAPDVANAMLVIYRADHVRIELRDQDPSMIEVDLPSTHLEALLFYVASRIHSGLSGEGIQEGNNYLAKFEASCRKIEELSIMNKDNTTNTKLEDSGWV